jgi:ABC-type transport system involved in multi-copper enzyme maturation permease subunit
MEVRRQQRQLEQWMRIEADQLRILGIESLRDAARRRVVPAVLVLCFLTLFMLNSCTSCSANMQVESNIAGGLEILGWGGIAAFTSLALWMVALSGLLAADHLSSALDDGTAQLVLARPVSRATFVLSRLFGSVAVSLIAGLIMQGGATFFFATRAALPIGPALISMLATAISCICFSAVAMFSSLYMNRLVTVLILLVLLVVMSILSLMALSGVELEGIYGAMERMGPTFTTTITASLLPWAQRELVTSETALIWARLLGWTIGAVAVLLTAFGRREMTDLGSD